MVNKIKRKIKNINNTLIELKKRIIFFIFATIMFRIGSFIPIPGLNHIVLLNFFKMQKSTILNMLNIFSGGSLSRASIFSLGIMPYILSSIIMQLLILMIKKLSEIKKEGEIGQNKINQYTRYITLIIAFLQAIGISITLPHLDSMKGLILKPNFSFYFISVLSLCTGTMLLMWFGELITAYGLGNGISVIIFINIISSVPFIFINTLNQVYKGEISLLFFFIICMIIFVVTTFVVFIERSYRKVLLHYPKPHNIHKMYIAKHTHLPLKINMSGVIPAIFASGIIAFFSSIFSFIGVNLNIKNFINMLYYLQPGCFLYTIVYSILVFCFCFIYSNISCNPRDISNNLKKSGVFIPGIRPGIKTARYINKIIERITVINAIYIIFICLLPDFLKNIMHFSFYFGGTSLLIVVVVIIDIVVQLQTLIISNKYNSILKNHI